MAEITTSTYTIRYATEHDVPEILRMIQELAAYERALHEVLATEEKLLNSLSFPTSTDPKFRSQPGTAKTLLIIPSSTSPASTATATTATGTTPKEQVAGMALFFNNYSTWIARPGIYLEDLFVRPEFRKKGYGKALLQALARECVEKDWGRLEWSVLRWNQPSIDFYVSEAIGATSLGEEWETMRVQGEKLEKLARSKAG